MAERLDELQPFAARHQQSLAGTRLRARRVDRGASRACRAAAARECALQRLLQAVPVVGLEQIVDRVQVEGPDGVLVECRHEYQQRRGVALELRGDFEAGQSGHLDVEEHDVGRERFDGRGGGEAIGGFAGDLDVGVFASQRRSLSRAGASSSTTSTRIMRGTARRAASPTLRRRPRAAPARGWRARRTPAPGARGSCAGRCRNRCPRIAPVLWITMCEFASPSRCASTRCSPAEAALDAVLEGILEQRLQQHGRDRGVERLIGRRSSRASRGPQSAPA